LDGMERIYLDENTSPFQKLYIRQSSK
jgi:hypothetical protein